MVRVSRLIAFFAALGLMVGAACTSPHHRADLLRTTADQSNATADPTTSTSMATGAGAPGDTSAPVVAPDNDPTPVLVHRAPTTRSSVAARPAVAVAPPRPPAVAHAAPVATRANGSPFPNPGPGPDVYAVVIGITAYQGGTHHTVGGAGDAAAFMDLLNRNHWPSDHIVALVDGAATGDNIRAAMHWLADHSSPNSFSLFHYSGHICQYDTGPCGGGHHYLWSVDNRMISNTEVGDVLRGIRGQGWVDISGCEAADFEQGIATPQRLFTAASQVNEKGYEDPDWHESVWTGLLVDQGMIQGRGDTNGDHRVSVQEAARWAQQQAPGMTTGQRHSPQHPFIAGGDGDWFLNADNPTNKPQPPPPSPSGGPPPPPGSPPPNRCGSLTNGMVKC